eukprot:1147499-Pelagomonas_calceolata.AAC.7
MAQLNESRLLEGGGVALCSVVLSVSSVTSDAHAQASFGVLVGDRAMHPCALSAWCRCMLQCCLAHKPEHRRWQCPPGAHHCQGNPCSTLSGVAEDRTQR